MQRKEIYHCQTGHSRLRYHLFIRLASIQGVEKMRGLLLYQLKKLYGTVHQLQLTTGYFRRNKSVSENDARRRRWSLSEL